MNIGVLIPGFSSDESDWAIPVQLNLAREQARHVDYRIIALRYPHRRDQYRVCGAHVYSLGYGAGARGVRRLMLWRETLGLLSRLHREKPFDVLHAMWADETGMIAGWFGRQHHIPVVVSILGGELATLPDIRYGGQLTPYGRWVTSRALALATRIHIVSGSVQVMLARSRYRMFADKTVPIPLGVDANCFSPHSDGAYHSRRLICVASLIPVKDHELLFYAVANMSPVTLDLVGDGTHRPYLENLARRLSITGQVRFLGNVPHEALPRHVQQAALHVLTSQHETFALSIAEAAACGVPSVTTSVGVLPDYPSMGIVVQRRDPKELADTLEAILSDTPRLQAMRRAARETVECDLTIQHTAARLRELYAELAPR